ncbi:MAG: hypothetical protein JSV73_01575 [Flavobacteriaceae bacterium]|nr:MAG: hypothetical protein JSV73_01575 [Flavobacteriaceae bacterium]
MKYFALILAFIMSVTAFSQVSLKGYTLGKKLKGVDKRHTTVAGIEGTLSAKTLIDDRIFMITFVSVDYTENFKNKIKIQKYQLDNLLEGVEKKYGVMLNLKDKEQYKYSTFDFGYKASKDGVVYDVSVQEEGDNSYVVGLAIATEDLVLEYNGEIQSDF